MLVLQVLGIPVQDLKHTSPSCKPTVRPVSVLMTFKEFLENLISALVLNEKLAQTIHSKWHLGKHTQHRRCSHPRDPLHLKVTLFLLCHRRRHIAGRHFLAGESNE